MAEVVKSKQQEAKDVWSRFRGTEFPRTLSTCGLNILL